MLLIAVVIIFFFFFFFVFSSDHSNSLYHFKIEIRAQLLNQSVEYEQIWSCKVKVALERKCEMSRLHHSKVAQMQVV